MVAAAANSLSRGPAAVRSREAKITPPPLHFLEQKHQSVLVIQVSFTVRHRNLSLLLSPPPLSYLTYKTAPFLHLWRWFMYYLSVYRGDKNQYKLSSYISILV